MDAAGEVCDTWAMVVMMMVWWVERRGEDRSREDGEERRTSWSKGISRSTVDDSDERARAGGRQAEVENPRRRSEPSSATATDGGEEAEPLESRAVELRGEPGEGPSATTRAGWLGRVHRSMDLVER